MKDIIFFLITNFLMKALWIFFFYFYFFFWVSQCGQAMVQLHFASWCWRSEGWKEEESFCLGRVRNKRAECLKEAENSPLWQSFACRRPVWEKVRQCQGLKDGRGWKYSPREVSQRFKEKLAFDEVESVGAGKPEGKHGELIKWFRVALQRECVQEQTELGRRKAVKSCELRQRVLAVRTEE